LPEGHPERDGLVGDLLVRGGVHTPQTDAILDVQVIYLNAQSRTRQAKGRRGRPKGRHQQATTSGPDAAEDSEGEKDEEDEQRGEGEGDRGEGGERKDEEGGGGESEGEGDRAHRGAVMGRSSTQQQENGTADRAAAILRTQEKAKESKHKTACEATRRDFIPFIVSTDGCLGEAAQAFLKRLGRRLAEKWQRAYSQVMGFLNARISVAILRASSQCMRGPRTRVQGAVCVLEDGAALGVVGL
jgi:hypothetical protein